MPIFHESALRGASDGDGSWIQPEHVANWLGVAAALDRLTHEQRCDAIYLDWLLQLNSPSRGTLLQVRDLLISQGALAANYLAELAQNADDAADGNEAELRVVLDGEWLFVSNNGRKVTSLNLLGLSRFFVHSAGRVQELNEKTIGRFGIGFKSCYRIASEVFVSSWDEQDQFGFRLPICRPDDAVSRPNPERHERLLNRLPSLGVRLLDPELSDLKCLGYCTPEFSHSLPPELAERTSDLRQTQRGTLFCFHLRPDRVAEVRNRISGGAQEVYELCPLFLPNIRLVQLGRNRLRMKVHSPETEGALVDRVEATKVELITKSAPDSVSTSRFWRLKGLADGDRWQVALHADSLHRLRVEQEQDEHGTTIKDGAAYAYFPLNSVTQTWPFRLHLHVALSTNLARDNWNPDEDALVREQIQRAISRLVEWLAQETARWHRDWRVDALVARSPQQAGVWARAVWDALRVACRCTRVMRLLSGGFGTAGNARAIAIIPKSEARSAWNIVLNAGPKSANNECLIEDDAIVPLATEKLSPGEIADLCTVAAHGSPDDTSVQRAALTAVLACEGLNLRSIEEVVNAVVCTTARGTKVPLRELLSQPAGAELIADWHETFALLSRWAMEASWRNTAVAGAPLQKQLNKLVDPVLNPTWRELAEIFPDEESWRQHGAHFWSTPRELCPTDCLNSALRLLRVPTPNGQWVSISNLWLDDDSGVVCFAGLLEEWPIRYSAGERAQITESLKKWGLFSAWETAAKKRLKENLPRELAQLLTSRSGSAAITEVFDMAFANARRHLDGGWAHIVEAAEKDAVEWFVRKQTEMAALARKTLVSTSIPNEFHAALVVVAGFISAPSWLSENAYAKICSLGLQGKLEFDFLDQHGFNREPEKFAQLILDHFHQWPDTEPSDVFLQGLQQLFSLVGFNRRRDLFVATSSHKRVRVREFFCMLSSSAANGSAGSRIMEARLVRAVKHVAPMPAPLDRIAALGEVAVNLSNLRCERESSHEVPLQLDQIQDVIAGDPDLTTAVTEIAAVFGAAQGLRLKWLSGDDLVAELSDADAGYFGGRLVFGHYKKPANEEQYVRLLSLYELCDVVTEEYKAAKARGVSAFDLYKSFRNHIVDVLVKKQVREVGYRKEHILRELLQNAENAYASKAEPVPLPWFDFCVDAAGATREHPVRVRHAGRLFNEADKTKQLRPDTERIVKINAPNQSTEQELGRFNRGFKSVFTVAKEGKVAVRSGAYRFEIHDLLLLHPAEPKPEHDREVVTEFAFSVSPSDALSLIGIKPAPAANAVPDSLNATSFLFLSELRRVKVQWCAKVWEWYIKSSVTGPKWTRMEIHEATTNTTDTFWVHSDQLRDKRRYGVAIRIGNQSEPRLLAKEWHKLRLTFETECQFGLDVLVNGDFESDQGRVNLRGLSSSGADIIEAALNAAVALAETKLRACFSQTHWLAWAKVLHLKDASGVLEAEFEKGSDRFSLWIERYEALMTSQVPCNRGPLDLLSAIFPTRLMRQLAKDFSAPWGIKTDNWIVVEAEAELPHRIRDKHPKSSLHKWISQQAPTAPILGVIQSDLRQPSFTALRRSFGKPETDELKEAERLLLEKLRPVQNDPQSVDEIVVPTIEEWTVSDLWHWWERQGMPITAYTLDGDTNWNLLFPGESGNTDSRRNRVKEVLLTPESDEGKRTWYRLLGLACLMSAGRRMTEVRSFWQTELEVRQFWTRTSQATFGHATDALFSDLISRPINNLAARGEHAYFWRRIFYDIRKIHQLVWENQFPSTMLELVRSGHGANLVNFLHTGQLPGQPAWVGVFGQSAGSPLFFVVRELCRLGVITDPAVRPLAFFVSTPVRRASERIGWLKAEEAGRVDFESLASMSEKFHRKIAEDRVYGARLLEYYDIPLLHFGLEG